MTDKKMKITACLFPYPDGSGYQISVTGESGPLEGGTIELKKFSDWSVDFTIDQWERIQETINDMVSNLRKAEK